LANTPKLALNNCTESKLTPKCLTPQVSDAINQLRDDSGDVRSDRIEWSLTKRVFDIAFPRNIMFTISHIIIPLICYQISGENHQNKVPRKHLTQ